MKDKGYLAFPLGQEADRYLAVKRRRLTVASQRDYESTLDKLARYFPTLTIDDFEPPHGTELLEQFLNDRYGDRAPRTYNKILVVLRDFFKFQVLRQRLHGDPTLPIEAAKKSDVYRTVFSLAQRADIIATARNPRDRVALRLLLNYGIRKGALQRMLGHATIGTTGDIYTDWSMEQLADTLREVGAA